jgi:uncharacterized membrane protein YfcA
LVVFGFRTHETVPLVNIGVFGSSFVTFLMNMKTKHPDRDTFGLDYELTGTFIPMLIFGTSLGVILNKILPFSIITIILFLLLLFSSYKSFLR